MFPNKWSKILLIEQSLGHLWTTNDDLNVHKVVPIVQKIQSFEKTLMYCGIQSQFLMTRPIQWWWPNWTWTRMDRHKRMHLLNNSNLQKVCRKQMCTTRAHLILLTRSTLGYPPICLYFIYWCSTIQEEEGPLLLGPYCIIYIRPDPMQAAHTGLVMRAALWGPPAGPNGDGT